MRPSPRRLVAAVAVLSAGLRVCHGVRRSGAPGEAGAPGAQRRAAGGGSARRLLRLVGASAILAAEGAGDQYAEARELTPEEMHITLDYNGDGVLDLDEYLSVAYKFIDMEGFDGDTQEIVLSHYSSLYAAGDINGDGVLDLREMGFAEALARKYGAPGADQDFGERFAAHLVLAFDINGDGRLNYGEYSASMHAKAADNGWDVDVGSPNYLNWVHKLFEVADVDHNRILVQKEVLFAHLLASEAYLEGRF